MERSELTEDFETGLFRHPDGRVFVRCEFNPEDPVWIDVSSDSWSATYSGNQHICDWSKIDASPKLISSLQDVLKDRLRTNSPSYLSRCEISLRKFFPQPLLKQVILIIEHLLYPTLTDISTRGFFSIDFIGKGHVIS